MIFFWLPLIYLIGSFPTAYIMGRWLKGIDIRQVGSGNVGATNVFRTVGKGAGLATLLIDMAKGALPVLISLRLFPGSQMLPILTGLAAVIGHTWSPFVDFKGGKGVATSAGVFAALLPGPTALAILAFSLGLWITKHVSIGSLLGAVTLPIVSFLMKAPLSYTLLAVALGLLILLRHIPNIRRLMRGEELALRAEDEKDKP